MSFRQRRATSSAASSRRLLPQAEAERWLLAARRRSGDAPAAHRASRGDLRLLVEQLGELLGHSAAELLGIDDGDGAPVIARAVMADGARDSFHRAAGLAVRS